MMETLIYDSYGLLNDSHAANTYLTHVTKRLGGAMITRLPLTSMTQVRVLAATWVWLCATCGTCTLHSQCLVVFPSGFSSTVRWALKCSDSYWDRLIRCCSGWHKTRVCVFTHVQLPYTCIYLKPKKKVDLFIYWKFGRTSPNPAFL